MMMYLNKYAYDMFLVVECVGQLPQNCVEAVQGKIKARDVTM